MRRPVAAAALAFGAGIIAAYHFKLPIIIWIILLTGLTALYIYVITYQSYVFMQKTIMLLCIVLSGSICFEAVDSSIDPFAGQYGSEAEIEGVVREVTVKDNMYSLMVKNEEGMILVKYYCEDSYLKTSRGSKIRVCGTPEMPQERRNPGCFDYRLYLKSCGVRTILKADSIEILDENAVKYLVWVGKLRNSFEEKLLESNASEKTGLIMAIMFGDKTLLDEELYSDFQQNGTAHVLAVSGLHTGIIYAFFAFLWRGKKGILFYVVTCVLLLFYMALADFSPSVVRASCMIILHLISSLARKRYDLISAAGVTFILMLVLNPFQIFHTGFQLSFLAIASLGVIMPFVQYFYQGIFLSAAAIQAGMMPYTAYLFNYISAGSVIANIPVIFLAGIILPVGLCALISSFIHNGIFEFLMIILDMSCDLLIWINGIFYASGATSFEVVSPSVSLLVLYYGLLFFFVSETGQLICIRKNFRKAVAAVVMIIALSLTSIPFTESPLKGAGIVFVDVGQGDCVHVQTPSGKNYLFDGGGSTDYDVGLKTVKPYLLKNGVRKVDAAFVTHLHEDHYGGIRSLAADGMVDKVAVYEANKYIEEQLSDETSAEIIYLHGGQRVELDEDVYVEILSPPAQPEEKYREMIKNSEDENESSLIMKICYNEKTVLITGDIDTDGEEELMRQCGQMLDSDIMKVPHHGSKYSSSETFVDIVSPELAVFQVGRNNYGHPAPEAIENYEKAGCSIARNDTNGAVGIIIGDDGAMKVVGMIH